AARTIDDADTTAMTSDDELLADAVGGAADRDAGAPRRRSRGRAAPQRRTPPPPRRGAGGRAAHQRSTLPPQRPWAQPRIPYRPVEVLSADEVESIHRASLRVLAEIGMDFLDEGARNLLKDAGADVRPDSQRVRFDPAMVEERIRTAPSE